MGSISAQKAWRVLKNVQTVLAIEMLCACQGLDFARKLNVEQGERSPHAGPALRAGEGTEAAYSVFRKSIPFMDRDRILYDDIQKALCLVDGKSIVQAVERKIGVLE
jgi:histidine ammonia-lyase